MHNEVIHNINFTTLAVSFTLLQGRKSERLLSEEQGTMVCVGFVIGKVAMAQVFFLQVLQFTLPKSFTTVTCTTPYSYFIHQTSKLHNLHN
jgi:hypothetical protein